MRTLALIQASLIAISLAAGWKVLLRLAILGENPTFRALSLVALLSALGIAAVGRARKSRPLPVLNLSLMPITLLCVIGWVGLLVAFRSL